MGVYPEFDRYGRIVAYAKRYMKTIAELLVDFPELSRQILDGKSVEDVDVYALLEMIRYEDADQITLFLPARNNLQLRTTPNPMGVVS